MKTDVVIVGGGPSGTAATLRLQQRGIQPVIIEREEFPRFHIGESMTGECGALVRDLGFGDRMLAAGHPVKHGVNVYGTRGNSDWWLPVMQRVEDNGELKEQFTWQVRRSAFDQMLIDEATANGAELVAGRAVAPLVADDGTVRGVRVRTADGTEHDIEAELTLDCSGQASFLANKKVTGPKYLGAYDKQIAIFAHVLGYTRDDGDKGEFSNGNTHIFYTRKYHWAWGIPIDADVTSVGIVVPAEYFRDKKESARDFVIREMRELNPGLARRCQDAQVIEDAHVIPNYSFQVRKFAGPGYICVGDSHRFVDPIFSFGLYVALKEAGLAADATERWLAGQGRDDPNPFHDYMVYAERGIDILEDVLDMFWENPLAFSVLVHNKYRGPMVDVFAGRIYEGMPHGGRDVAVERFRKLLGRERTYDADGMFSMPIGSRFHPERAPLWNSALDSIETTEDWMRDDEVGAAAS